MSIYEVPNLQRHFGLIFIKIPYFGFVKASVNRGERGRCSGANNIKHIAQIK